VLGTDPAGAAEVVLEVAESHMAGFLRSELAGRGIPPGRTTLIAFGGAGPAHAASVARRLGLRRVVVPYLAAGLSALGCLLCPPAQVALLAVDESLRGLSPDRLREHLAAAFPLETAGRPRLALVVRRGDNPHEDLLPVRDLEETAEARLARYQDFARQAYGIRPAPGTIRVVRLLAILERGQAAIDFGPALEATFHRQRERWARHGTAPAPSPSGIPVYPVEALPLQAAVRGPALVLLPGSSVFVPEGLPCHVDGWGNLILETAP
jgi:N-methylhydantoinase A